MNSNRDQGRSDRWQFSKSFGIAISLASVLCGPTARTSHAIDPATAANHAELLPILPLGTELTSQRGSDRHSPIVRAIQLSESAVVNIQGNKTITTAASSGTVKQEVSGMGTGVIIDPRGYIITNLHVVQDVPRIEVTLATGKSEIAKLLNYDLDTDLALIKIDTSEQLPVIPFGTSHDLLRGETVVAIGNPFGYQNTVTMGIVSALHRDVPVNGSQQYRDLIQTSADINPGNSGGPLLNINGEVIGINVAVRVGAQGIGFAIPIDQAMDVMADLIAANRSETISHGVVLERSIDADGMRWRVRDMEGKVQQASSRRSQDLTDFGADRSGLQRGDILIAVDGHRAPPRLALELAMVDRRAGDSIAVEIQRDGLPARAAVRLENTESKSRSIATAVDNDLAWKQLGVRLTEVDAESVRTPAEAYQGGMKVLEVRPGSPAALQKISKGDIIVGILSWQTPNEKSLNWVLTHNDFRKAPSTKFYVVRNNRTFYVAMDLAQSNKLQ